MTGLAAIVVHRRGWLAFWRGIDSDVDDPKDPQASAWRGFLKWIVGFFYRGYAVGNRVYSCPWFPSKLLAHECAHTPALGSTLPTLVTRRDLDGGLRHEPFRTRDIMLPGYLSPFRRRDLRGIEHATLDWLDAEPPLIQFIFE